MMADLSPFQALLECTNLEQRFKYTASLIAKVEAIRLHDDYELVDLDEQQSKDDRRSGCRRQQQYEILYPSAFQGLATTDAKAVVFHSDHFVTWRRDQNEIRRQRSLLHEALLTVSLSQTTVSS